MNIRLERFIDPALLDHVEESRILNAERSASGERRGPANAEELAAARAAIEAVPVSGRAEDRVVRAAGREVGVRVIAPASGTSRAVYVDVHGGGFYMGTPVRGDARNVRLADALDITVVSVDYRLAPEHPWPAAPDDVETALLWATDDVATGFGPGGCVIGGSSAGATLVMAALLRLRDRGLIAPVRGAVLTFGAFDLSGRTPFGRRYADEWFIQAYAGHVADRAVPDISPIFGDMWELPPTLVVVGALDLLLEDSLAMAARLSVAGNDVDLRVFPESVHGFTGLPTAMARAAETSTAAWIAERLDGSAVRSPD